MDLGLGLVRTLQDCMEILFEHAKLRWDSKSSTCKEWDLQFSAAPQGFSSADTADIVDVTWYPLDVGLRYAQLCRRHPDLHGKAFWGLVRPVDMREYDPHIIYSLILY